MPMFTPTPNDTLISPEVAPDGRVTFRLYAPRAAEVTVTGEVAPGFGQPLKLTKDERGVWTGTSAALTPGAYRYTFVVDGVSVVDPKNRETSASQSSVSSLVEVSSTGGDFQADRPGIPHGAVSVVYYPSPALGQRRMRIYTPPGYRKGHAYPVLYLIHGGGDSDESWSTVGRAGFILDNLIADGRAKPMIVVMPFGGVGARSAPMTSDPDQDPFTQDLLQGIIPYVEKNYDVSARPENRALAGLSMGGIQTLNIGLTHLDRFRYLGVFSSGWFPSDLQAFETKYGNTLGSTNTPPKLFWMAYGETDIARPQAEKVLQMFDRHGFKYVSERTEGGHTWINWRRYLNEFAPLLFR
ncbi:MAG: esterase [Armatimonadetes bacterium]|nr:esterase [Armatimonadota bacterium]